MYRNTGYAMMTQTNIISYLFQLDIDPACIKFLKKVTSEIIRQGIYSDNGIRRALDNCLALTTVTASGRMAPSFTISKVNKSNRQTTFCRNCDS